MKCIKFSYIYDNEQSLKVISNLNGMKFLPTVVFFPLILTIIILLYCFYFKVGKVDFDSLMDTALYYILKQLDF